MKPGRSLGQVCSGGAVAQLGARLDGIEEVVGSNPIGSTKFIPVYYLYILQSETTGRFLKNRGPWNLVYTETFATRGAAVRRECEIKAWKDRRMIEKLLSASR